MIVRAVLSVLAVVSLGVLTYANNQPLFLVGGSEAASTILAPSVFGQITALGFAALSAALCAMRIKNRLAFVRWVLLLVALGVYVLSSHRLVVIANQGQVRDLWMLARVQTLSFDPADGSSGSILRRQSTFWLRLERSSTEEMRVFLGFGPWRLDAELLDVYWPRSS